MALHREMQERNKEIVETMISHIHLTEGGPNASDVRQFVTGFVSLVQSAAGGDMTARDEYLTAVIPSVKHAGISLELTMVSMVQISVLLAGLLGREHVLGSPAFSPTTPVH